MNNTQNLNEIDVLLNELRNMKAEAKAHLLNNKETWSKIGNKDLSGLGFNSVDELQAWLLENPYSNIA
jgi:hypothetical protein